MTRTVYFVSGSPFAWRVMLAMGLKGLEYEAVELHGSKGDLKTPEYLQLNPRGKVPVLVDGDVTVYESLAILAYLDRAYPEKQIFGHTPADAALIWQRVAEVDAYLGAAMVGAVRPVFTGAYEGKESEINESFATIRAEITTANQWLGDNDFIVGNTPTAADITLYPALAMLARVGSAIDVPGITPNLPDYTSELPALVAWMKRIEALPGYDAAYPPHWR
ncbi:glutathione S-transferase family protein [Kordiimonas aquimaris]|uniref:glutathione S-transferase family protein n=1 Tax=Kordiimonas aquimaris TaxID=707591 RepID=UPI0021CE9DAB|nr:glutathione S-transferase family protein [Kordiimonas aquimaris]